MAEFDDVFGPVAMFVLGTLGLYVVRRLVESHLSATSPAGTLVHASCETCGSDYDLDLERCPVCGDRL